MRSRTPWRTRVLVFGTVAIALSHASISYALDDGAMIDAVAQGFFPQDAGGEDASGVYGLDASTSGLAGGPCGVRPGTLGSGRPALSLLVLVAISCAPRVRPSKRPRPRSPKRS